ncbi:universal stress protein [Microbacterium cremeum]|uniref:universal stress protein n=1 Tax=Microbacterium cremeum TaxID=2782169 RepID=UPI0018877B8C|nr:universal stress protein [Microbacterium cremeum]
MKRLIAVGVTDAAASRRAVDWAVRRAQDRRERILLVSVVEHGAGIGGESALVDAALAATEQLLDDRAAMARAAGLDVTVRLARGRPLEQLLEISRDADLLVIGSDYSGERHARARGPRGIRVSAGAHCPVAVIPDMDLDDRSGVVVGVDGSEVSEHAIRFAAQEADRTHEPLTAVAAWSPFAVPLEIRSYPEDYLTNMQNLTEETLGLSLAGLREDYPDLQLRSIVEAGYPAEVLCREAERARLVVVGSHGRGGIARFLLGSTSQTLLDRMPTAVAIVR